MFGLTEKSIMGGRQYAGADGGRVNPMERVIEAVRSSGKPLTFGALLEQAAVMDVHASHRGNLSGLDVSGFTFTEADVKTFQQAAGAGAEIHLNGSNISGCVFRPASTFNGCIIDQCTIANSDMTSLHFVGLTEEAHLNFAHVDVSGMTVSGTEDASASRNVNINLTGCKASDMDIGGSKLTVLRATDSTLDGLNATCARSLKLDVAGGSLRQADFTNVSFAPGSSVEKSDLRGARFAGADIGELNLAGSRIDPAALYGAYDGATKIDAANAMEVIERKGAVAEAGGATVANIPLQQTDALINQMWAAKSAAAELRGGQQADATLAQVASLPNARPDAGAYHSV